MKRHVKFEYARMNEQLDSPTSPNISFFLSVNEIFFKIGELEIDTLRFLTERISVEFNFMH
jgi:hypothetical protein